MDKPTTDRRAVAVNDDRANGNTQEWAHGNIVTLAFESGNTEDYFCGLEDCECPDHEQQSVTPGLYVTIRLDQERPVSFGRVAIRLPASCPDGHPFNTFSHDGYDCNDGQVTA